MTAGPGRQPAFRSATVRGNDSLAAEVCRDAVPFVVNVAHAPRRPSGPGVPVAGIARVAFDEMEQRMNPRSVRCVNFLGDVVRVVPAVLFRQPERVSVEIARQAGQRLLDHEMRKQSTSHGR